MLKIFNIIITSLILYSSAAAEIIRIFEFLNPEYLKIFISSLSNNLIKNNWVDIKKINGNISNIVVGEFSKDR